MEQNKNMHEGMMPTPMDTKMQTAPKAPMEPMPMTMDMMPYQAVYPEIYYRLQPYVLMVIDQMDAYGPTMPSQDMIEQLSDSIYDDACRMYPDMMEYDDNEDMQTKEDVPVFNGMDRYNRAYGMFGRRHRRRRPIRNLIDILLLSELFRRRRRHY